MSYIIAIGLYLVLLMVYGLVIAHKKVKTTDDMMTGGAQDPLHHSGGQSAGHPGAAAVSPVLPESCTAGGPWVGALAYAAPPIASSYCYFIAGESARPTR